MKDVFNFTITRGQDYESEFLVRDTETHVPIDITDMEFASDCRDNISSGELLFSFTFEKNADPLTGLVIMSVPRSITSTLTASAGVYDVFVTYTSTGKREPYFRGKITFARASTQEVPVVSP